MALPATREKPLPELWIWLLRLQGMSEEQRQGFAAGKVELSRETEEAAWSAIYTSLLEQREWYEEEAAASPAEAEGGEGGGKAEGEEGEEQQGAEAPPPSGPSSESLARDVRRAALEITGRALALLTG